MIIRQGESGMRCIGKEKEELEKTYEEQNDKIIRD